MDPKAGIAGITQQVEGQIKVTTETAQKIYTMIAEYLVKYGMQALFGIVILFVGFRVAAWVSKLVADLCAKRHMDVTLTGFIAMTVRVTIIIFTALVAADKFGLTISPLIAAVSAAVFGASFAVQAPLSNYAAGLTLILSRPFVVGDTVTLLDHSGVVEEVKLAATTLSNEMGQRITIPNKHIVGEVVVNSKESRLASGQIGISYDSDHRKAIAAIERTLASLPDISKELVPIVGIQSFGDFSVNLEFKYRVPTCHYGKLVHAANQAIYEALKKEGISIPYPRQEVFKLN